MTLRWCRGGNYWYELETGAIENRPGKYHQQCTTELSGLQLISDLKPYKSPVDGKVIEGRYARREDLKRAGCREADPSEWKGGYTNKRFAEKHGLPYSGEQ